MRGHAFSTDMHSPSHSRRQAELAAFLGHTLHESGDFVYPREISQCGSTTTYLGETYCVLAGTSYSAYCSTSHTTGSNPPGCNCGAVAKDNTAGGFRADDMFFGRGPVSA